ncbi:hypothetical protein ACS78_19460 [Priestia megaterium]|uniref:DUF1206 domain-containing protein n=1 Tax=Priestia megaterium TaxID=1404 RepID=UPI0006823B69|nr:DUF1206 domain-containing protein [Priestia megaterium]KNH19768.1 hypothetical protein ACS78_19460 [Priestia megaterium]
MGESPFVKKDTLGRKLHRLKERTKPFVVRFSRFGHVAQGVVYFIIGILAIQTAFGLKGDLVTSQGALHTIAKQPFGFLILIVLAVGLSGYAFWQIISAIFDPHHVGHGGKGVFTRLGYLVVATFYISLCVSSVKILLHAHVHTSGKHYQTVSAKLLSYPFGQTIIALTGIGIIIFGIGQVYWALSGRFLKKLKKNEMSKEEWRWSGHVGKVGIIARSIVFGIIGFFLIRTALQADPDETKGLDGALAEVAQRPFGSVLLAIVSIGLMAYGVYMFAESRYKRIDP